MLITQEGKIYFLLILIIALSSCCKNSGLILYDPDNYPMDEEYFQSEKEGQISLYGGGWKYYKKCEKTEIKSKIPKTIRKIIKLKNYLFFASNLDEYGILVKNIKNQTKFPKLKNNENYFINFFEKDINGSHYRFYIFNLKINSLSGFELSEIPDSIVVNNIKESNKSKYNIQRKNWLFNNIYETIDNNEIDAYGMNQKSIPISKNYDNEGHFFLFLRSLNHSKLIFKKQLSGENELFIKLNKGTYYYMIFNKFGELLIKDDLIVK